MKDKSILYIIIFLLLFLLLWLLAQKRNQRGEKYDELSGEVPTVAFPFKNLFDDKGNKLNVILLSAPFRGKDNEELYASYKRGGMNFCGISSYINFPDKIHNPFEDTFHERQKHDYVSMASTWLYCSRTPTENIKRVPHTLLTEADLKNVNHYTPGTAEKEYDYMIVCLEDNPSCSPGWNSYNRNWELTKKCLVVLSQRGLKGVVIGRDKCKNDQVCSVCMDNHVTLKPMLQFHDFSAEMKKCRFLVVPNIYDASPRIITEALCYNLPVIVNKHIHGGWHNVIPGVTGEFFSDETDLPHALRDIKVENKYQPRDWYVKHRGLVHSGKKLAEFLIEHYPNLNYKTMSYASITI